MGSATISALALDNYLSVISASRRLGVFGAWWRPVYVLNASQVSSGTGLG